MERHEEPPAEHDVDGAMKLFGKARPRRCFGRIRVDERHLPQIASDMGPITFDELKGTAISPPQDAGRARRKDAVISRHTRRTRRHLADPVLLGSRQCGANNSLHHSRYGLLPALLRTRWADGPYRGKVIDAETKAPIEGAVVVGVWRRQPALAMHPKYLFEEAKEVLTDTDGEFTLPGHFFKSIPSPLSEVWVDIYIYKPGYGASPVPDIPAGVNHTMTKLGLLRPTAGRVAETQDAGGAPPSCHGVSKWGHS
jgi:hypothetical protein